MLNPIVAAASNFEEAEECIQQKIPGLVNKGFDQVEYIMNHVLGHAGTYADNELTLLKVRGTPLSLPPKTRWWMTPFFTYFMWPVLGAVCGAFITYVLGLLVSSF